MHFIQKELSLDTKGLVAPFLQKEKIPFSERAFSTLYLYRTAHNLKLLSMTEKEHPEERYLGFVGMTYDNKRIFMPLEEKMLLNTKFSPLSPMLAHELGIEEIYPLQEKTARHLSLQGFKISYNIDDGDYLMSRKLLAEYPGRSLDGRRNLVHQFLHSGEVSIQKLSDRTRDDALHILTEWNTFHENDSSLVHEKIASREGVIEQKTLGIEGWIVYLDNIPQALCYGELLTESVYLIHCAKAISNTVKGALPYLHQEIAKQLPESIIYINWEQDLGLEGLRKSKLAYEPASFACKWRARITFE